MQPKETIARFPSFEILIRHIPSPSYAADRYLSVFTKFLRWHLLMSSYFFAILLNQNVIYNRMYVKQVQPY